jgi:excisionase family DNA binding protein
MAKQIIQKRWITVAEAAERVSITPHYLRQLILSGQLPAGIAHRPRPKGHWRIDVEALDEWMRNGCFTVPPDEGGDGEDVA